MIFVMYYIYYACLLKLCYFVFKGIPYIDHYMTLHPNETWVTVCNVMFGLNKKT
jgi:hypothetical protein